MVPSLQVFRISVHFCESFSSVTALLFTGLVKIWAQVCWYHKIICEVLRQYFFPSLESVYKTGILSSFNILKNSTVNILPVFFIVGSFLNCSYNPLIVTLASSLFKTCSWMTS